MDEREVRERGGSDSPLADMIDSAARRIMVGLMIGGGVIALAVYSRPGPPRFEVDVMGSTVIRTDIRSGTVLACEGQRCYRVVRRGQRLEDEPAAKDVPAPPAQPALPAPAPASPTSTPTPTPTPAQR